MEISKKVLAHQSLNFEEARQLLTEIREDCYSDEQLKTLLTALHTKGETVDEIAGFASVMREHALPITPRARVVVDTAGTGGDGHNTFNISTAAAFVIAGAGIAIAKHGNRGATSQTGSADVMAALGVELDLPASAVEECLNEIGIAFCFAQRFHRATERVAKVRRELGFRTIFNLLGPLTNPARVKRQIIGVCDPETARKLSAACDRLGSEHVWVVCGEDGLDELSISSITFVSEMKQGKSMEFEIIPEDLGFARGQMEDLGGGDAPTNATHLRNVLSGEDQSARRDAVLLNAAAGIFVAGAESLEQALRSAQDSIDDGAALQKLHQLVSTTQRLKQPKV
ncbi:MAG: anthranilate phosphoribosyltransferase [Acidobacteriia bacterium]|nr:anthranilate phosphoribosyltransferase [Terriglobia bacterium]